MPSKSGLKNRIIEFCTETEEEAKERRMQKYSISTPEDIDRLLSSNLPYKEKLEILEKERQRVTSLENEFAEAEYNFLNTDKYLKGMKKNLKGVVSDLEIEIPCAITGFAAGTVTYSLLIHFLHNHRLSDLQVYQAIPCFLGTVVAPLVTIYYSYYVLKDSGEYSDYGREIEYYQRKLNRNKRQ